jgi:hypothetical protein
LRADELRDERMIASYSIASFCDIPTAIEATTDWAARQVIHFFKIESHQAGTPGDESGFCKRERACSAEFHAAEHCSSMEVRACSFPRQNSVFIAPDFALPLLQMQGCETFRADPRFGARPFSLCSGVLAGFNCAFGSLAVGDPRLPGEREDSAQGTVVLSFKVKTG